MVYFRVITSNEYASSLVFKVEKLICELFDASVKILSKPYWKSVDFVEIEFEINRIQLQPLHKFQVFFEKSIDVKPSNISQEYGRTEIEYYGKVFQGERYFAVMSIDDEHIQSEDGSLTSDKT